MDFFELKLLIIDATGLAKDALHVHIGLAVFILTRLVWRGRGGWIAAWTVALIGAGAGEWLDARSEATRGATTPMAAHWHDIWNTMLWPSILLIVGRWLEPTKASLAADSSDNGEQALEQA